MNKTITASPKSAKELYWALKQLPMQRCPAHGTRSRGQCGCQSHMFYSPADNKVWVKNPLTGQIELKMKPYINVKKRLDKQQAQDV